MQEPWALAFAGSPPPAPPLPSTMQLPDPGNIDICPPWRCNASASSDLLGRVSWPRVSTAATTPLRRAMAYPNAQAWRGLKAMVAGVTRVYVCQYQGLEVLEELFCSDTRCRNKACFVSTRFQEYAPIKVSD